jgi:GH15 family glucan-1,4-alpha-glucosidase
VSVPWWNDPAAIAAHEALRKQFKAEHEEFKRYMRDSNERFDELRRDRTLTRNKS